MGALGVCVWALVGAGLALGLAYDEKWGYVDVRPGAHMFWWLYHASDSAPLVMWLQGGPGASGTGFGNFQEIGPLNVTQQPRDSTWLSRANLLFVDNPVGTGFSYVQDDSKLTKNNKEIAQDLVTFLTAFLKEKPEYSERPFYVFSESYGGKMTAGFAVELRKAIAAGSIKCNFKAIALGDSWISPIDSVRTWGPYLQAYSLIDETEAANLNQLADDTETAIKEGRGTDATSIWSEIEDLIEEYTDNVDFYNILKHNFDDTDPRLEPLMNGDVKQRINVIPPSVDWGMSSSDVFNYLSNDFMNDVISDVDTLLADGFKVVVYSGQLDLIVDSLGTEHWIQKLKWSELASYNNARKQDISIPSGEFAGTYKQYKNFYTFWIANAGHMVPSDAPEAALKMLDIVLGSSEVAVE